MALLLRKRGIERVRPLSGGFDAWRDEGLPVESADGHLVTRSGAAPQTGRTADATLPVSLGEAEVLDESGETVALHSLWQQRPVVLVFLRHFGCVLCRSFVMKLQPRLDAIRELGADVVVIGNGQPDAAGRFRALFQLDCPVLVDPQRRVYEALGFRRDLGGAANPIVFLRAIRAMLRGARQGPTEGDAWQLGGVLVVDSNGEPRFHHPSRHAGDHPQVDELLATLRSVCSPT